MMDYRKLFGNPSVTRIRKPVTYIHYGAECFEPNKWKDIKNRDNNQIHGWIKPAAHTGLWASPVNSLNSWKIWAENNDYETGLDTSFKFKVRDPGRIFYVHNLMSYSILVQYYGIKSPFGVSGYDRFWFDFERMANDGWDGLEISLTEYPKLYDLFYGWDCDSIIIFNRDAIQEVNHDGLGFDIEIHSERRDPLGDIFDEWNTALSGYVHT